MPSCCALRRGAADAQEVFQSCSEESVRVSIGAHLTDFGAGANDDVASAEQPEPAADGAAVAQGDNVGDQLEATNGVQVR